MKHTLKLLVTEAVIVDRQLHLLARRLRALKTQIIHTAAHCHPHRPTEGGGRSWIAEGFDGSIARVSFPAHTLLSIVDPETDQGRHLIAKLGPRKLEFLHPVIHYQPVLDFRDRVRAAFENTQSREILAACQTPTPPPRPREHTPTPRNPPPPPPPPPPPAPLLRHQTIRPRTAPLLRG